MGHFQVFFFFPAYVHAQGLRNTIKRLPHYFHVTSRKFFRLCISHPFLAFFLSQSPGFFLGGCISILLSALGWWLIQTVWVVSELMSLTSKCMSARILGPSLSETCLASFSPELPKWQQEAHLARPASGFPQPMERIYRESIWSFELHEMKHPASNRS